MAKPQAIVPAEVTASLPLDLSILPDDATLAPDLLDAELHEWKAQRSFKIPWRQLSLMASICFGLASFVLPAGIGDAVDWLLYGLSAISLYIWFTGRRAGKKAAA